MDRLVRWALLIMAALVFVLVGARLGAGIPDELIDLAMQLVAGVCLAWWAVLDARERGTPIPGSLPFLMWMVWPIAIPVYLVWSRGWRGLAIAAGAGVALAGLVLVAAVAAGMATA